MERRNGKRKVSFVYCCNVLIDFLKTFASKGTVEVLWTAMAHEWNICVHRNGHWIVFRTCSSSPDAEIRQQHFCRLWDRCIDRHLSLLFFTEHSNADLLFNFL